MDYVSGVNVLETAKGLINKRLEVGVRKGLLGSDLRERAFSDWWIQIRIYLTYDGMQICLHQLLLEV